MRPGKSSYSFSTLWVQGGSKRGEGDTSTSPLLIHSFVHSLYIKLLRTSYVADTDLGLGERKVKRSLLSALMETMV